MVTILEFRRPEDSLPQANAQPATEGKYGTAEIIIFRGVRITPRPDATNQATPRPTAHGTGKGSAVR